uniref:Fibrinogen C-terminal domain-containing protein n=2 Tax=Macrostomum lignano TaxID=282301 RepID=A0A1I8HMU6_9PLAT
MKFLILLLLATTSACSAFMSVNFQDSGVVETGRLNYKGVKLRSFSIDGLEVLEPYIALQASEKAKVRKTPVGNGYYFSVPLIVDYKPNATLRDKPLGKMTIMSVSVKLRQSLVGGCRKNCSDLTVTNLRKRNQQSVLFRCRRRSVCQRIFNALHFRTTSSDFIRSAMEFTFFGVSNGRSLRLTKSWVPVVKTSSRPYSDELWFEGDKLLLFTIKAGCGASAYESYNDEHRYSIPTDGTLPEVYRSQLLDDLPSALATRSGNWEMVAEMRVGDDRVAQVVFDVSKNRDSIDKTSWFNRRNVKSSYPFWVGRSNFNFFSIAGNGKYKRRFFINNKYGGCAADEGFWTVSDVKDPCPWGNGGWNGRVPTLVYNKYPGKYQNRGAAYADRFFIYLRYSSVPAASGSLPEKSFKFEGNKILLFTIKSGIGKGAYSTFSTKQTYPIPADKSLPNVYRSDLLDNLADTVIESGKKFIVAEMRVKNKPVSQVFFDVSVRRRSLNLHSWFSASRVVSSSPYFVGSTGFNFFAPQGDARYSRRFFISNRYGGCNGDTAFWAVSDKKDPCPWSNRFWTGKAPVLVYNTKQNSPTYRTGAKADRFLIYLV